MGNLRDAISGIIQLQKVRGQKEKLFVIAKNKDNCFFRQLLYYACHPLLSYKVSEATLTQTVGYTHQITPKFTSIFDVCETLSRRKALDDDTLRQVRAFLLVQSEEDRALYKKLLAKTLRLGVTAKSVNKVIPGLIPEWEVQQAYPIEKHPLRNGAWFSVSEKLNGVRATFYRGEMIGRSGSVLDGLDHISNTLSAFPEFVFDGELTLSDKGSLSDNEAFRITTGIVNADDSDKTRICFTIFDLLPVEEFDSGISSATYRERRNQLDKFTGILKGNEYVRVLPSLYSGSDQSVIPVLLDQMVNADKEGLMVNLDVPYQCKRHSGILKVKRFYTMDLPIIRCESGTGKLSDTLGAIIVDYLGTEVGVGSGFTDEQRRWVWSHRDEVIGVLAEVKYKEISFDKVTGKRSLQFPVFVSLRTDKDDVSFG